MWAGPRCDSDGYGPAELLARCSLHTFHRGADDQFPSLHTEIDRRSNGLLLFDGVAVGFFLSSVLDLQEQNEIHHIKSTFLLPLRHVYPLETKDRDNK